MIKGLSLSLIASSFAFSAHAMAPINVPLNSGNKASVASNTSDQEPVDRVPAPDTAGGDIMGTHEQGRSSHFEETSYQDNEAQPYKQTELKENESQRESMMLQGVSDDDDTIVLDRATPNELSNRFHQPYAKDAYNQMMNDPMALIEMASTFTGTVAEVDLSHNVLNLKENGEIVNTYKISSARAGYANAPVGCYSSLRYEVMHYSHKYHNSPMPHAIFFLGGFAIHGTYETNHLGHPASHGCVRVSPTNAAAIYDAHPTHVCIVGRSPVAGGKVAPEGDDSDAAPVVKRKPKHPRNDSNPYDQDSAPPSGYYAPPVQEAPRDNGFFPIPGFGNLFGQ